MSFLKGLLLLGLFATGCAAVVRKRPEGSADPEGPGSTEPRQKLTGLRFQVDDDSELAEDARIAARTWSEATGRSITATPDGDIPILLVEELSASCDTSGHPNARGCAHEAEELTGGWIEVLSSVHPHYRYGVVLHEMGHHLRGTGEHLSNPDAVMSADRKLDVYLPTPDDVAFVCSGPRFSCA